MQALIIFVLLVLIIVLIIVLINLSNIIKLFNKKDTPGQTTPRQTTPRQTTPGQTTPGPGRYDLNFNFADDTLKTLFSQLPNDSTVFPELTDEQMQVLSHVFEPIMGYGVICQRHIMERIERSLDSLNPKHLLLKQTISLTKQEQDDFWASFDDDEDTVFLEDAQILYSFMMMLLAVDIITVQSVMTDEEEAEKIRIRREADTEFFPSEQGIQYMASQYVLNGQYPSVTAAIAGYKENAKLGYASWKSLINSFTNQNLILEAEIMKSTDFWTGYETSIYFLEPDDPLFLVPAAANREIYWSQRCNQTFYMDTLDFAPPAFLSNTLEQEYFPTGDSEVTGDVGYEAGI